MRRVSEAARMGRTCWVLAISFLAVTNAAFRSDVSKRPPFPPGNTGWSGGDVKAFLSAQTPENVRKMIAHYRDTGRLADVERKVIAELARNCTVGLLKRRHILEDDRTFCLVQNVPHCLRGITDSELYEYAKNLHCAPSAMKSKVSAMGSRLCKYLMTQEGTNDEMARKIQALGSFMSSMPQSCVGRLLTMKPMELEDIMKLAMSSMLDKSEAKMLMKKLLERKRGLSFEDKLRLPQSLRDVMGASEFKAIKQLGATRRHLFLRSVIKAKVERLRQRSQMESRVNQKVLRAKKKESFMKPSLQNVLTVDLLRPIDENVDSETIKNLMETPELLGCISNNEMRKIQKKVLCAELESDDSDMFKDLTEAQRRLVYERCQNGTTADDLPGSLLSTMTSTEMETIMDQMDAEELEKMVKKLSMNEQLLNSEQVGTLAKKCSKSFRRELSQANITDLRVWVKRLRVTGLINETLKTPEDINHYCQEMAKATFDADDAVQVRDILDYCIHNSTVPLNELGELTTRLEYDHVDLRLPELEDSMMMLGRNVHNATVRRRLLSEYINHTSGLHPSPSSGRLHPSSSTGGLHPSSSSGGVAPIAVLREVAPLAVLREVAPLPVLREVAPFAGLREVEPLAVLRAAAPLAVIREDDFARSLPDLYQEVSDMRTACRASHGCSGALVEALRDSDSKIFQMLATRHSLITTADEKADTTTETRRKRAVGDALSCATLRAMNPSSLSVEQLGELTKEIFEGCADRLGSAVGYSNRQLTVLGSKAAQFYPKLNDTRAQSLGVILLALPVTLKEIVNWVSDDITTAAGKVDSGATRQQALSTEQLHRLTTEQLDAITAAQFEALPQQHKVLIDMRRQNTDGWTGGHDITTGGYDGRTGGSDGKTGGSDGTTGGSDGKTGGFADGFVHRRRSTLPSVAAGLFTGQTPENYEDLMKRYKETGALADLERKATKELYKKCQRGLIERRGVLVNESSEGVKGVVCAMLET
ncbi:hypothetical protein LSAT2_027510 [Lamellibrachia satsuma]|nr:hypothetical protein LSAT2_027510 [Lamellibrachia satsuma]